MWCRVLLRVARMSSLGAVIAAVEEGELRAETARRNGVRCRTPFFLVAYFLVYALL